MPRKRDLTDEQVLEVTQFIDQERKHGRTMNSIASSLDLGSAETVRHYQTLSKRPGKRAYEAMQRTLAARTGGEVPPAHMAPAPAPPAVRPSGAPARPSPLRASVLDDLGAARRAIDEAISAVERASTTSVPLLRPGLEQLARRLRDSRSWLEVDG